jgi:hypothetical protein
MGAPRGQDRWWGGGCRRRCRGGAGAGLLRRRPSTGCEGHEGEHQCPGRAGRAETEDGRDQIGRQLLHLVSQSIASCPGCGRGTNILKCDTLSHAPGPGESTAALSLSGAPREPLDRRSGRRCNSCPGGLVGHRRHRRQGRGRPDRRSGGVAAAWGVRRAGVGPVRRRGGSACGVLRWRTDGLHDLAARTAEVDRAVTADLLRAKERIEALMDPSSASDIQSALADLADATGAATRTLDPEAATSCP